MKELDLARLKTGLAEQLGMPVTVNCDGDDRGRLVVEFTNLEILKGVLERIGVRS